jgi:hypothetical protein
MDEAFASINTQLRKCKDELLYWKREFDLSPQILAFDSTGYELIAKATDLLNQKIHSLLKEKHCLLKEKNEANNRAKWDEFLKFKPKDRYFK